jgi:GT2 family glycosyltransferase
MSTAVLIVNFRGYDDLARCLGSLEPCLAPDDEVIVVDYESDRAALNAATAPFPRVVGLPRTDNRGFAAGVNLGAAHSRSPFLLLLNPDSIVEGPVVRVLEEWLTAHADVGVAGPRVLNADGSIQPSARRFPDLTTWFGGRSSWFTSRFPGNWFSRRNLIGLEATAPVDVDWVSGACLMTRRDVFDRVGGFDDGFFLYWEDADYCRRVSQAGFPCMYVPAATVRHAVGRSSERDPIPAIRAFHQSAYRLYRKHASPTARLVSPLVRAGLWLRGQHRIRRLRGR